MKEIPDKSIDLVLTDPPYGLGAADKNFIRYKKQTGRSLCVSGIKYIPDTWDVLPSQDYFDEIINVSKNQIIFGGNFFNLPPSPCWIVWDKDNGKNKYADCELAWTSFRSAVRKIRFKWHGMFQEDMTHKEERVHPTQKPVKLIEWCLLNYSKPGDLILDPFLGSGTTAVACKRTGRNFIGIEKEPKYVEIALKRLEKVNNAKLTDFTTLEGLIA